MTRHDDTTGPNDSPSGSTSEPEPVPTMAIVTPTFPPDLERCELLVESVRRFGDDVVHHLVVERRHAHRFGHLAGPSTEIVVVEDLLPGRSWLIPGRRGIRIRTRGLPVRGWIVQQVAKIALASRLGTDIVVFCDSDTCFVRPFAASDFLVDNRPGLIDVGFTTDDLRTWTTVACELLGVDRPLVAARNHVGAMVCWRPEVVRTMIERIEQATEQEWSAAVMRRLTVSEYVLYGVYVRGVLGYPASGHMPSTAPLVHLSYGYDLTTPDGRQTFFSGLEDHQLGVMVHSKDRVPVAAYRDHIEEMWARWSSG